MPRMTITEEAPEEALQVAARLWSRAALLGFVDRGLQSQLLAEQSLPSTPPPVVFASLVASPVMSPIMPPVVSAGDEAPDFAPLTVFLEGIGLRRHLQLLMENEVDLETLRMFSETDLQDLGLPKGPRVKIIRMLLSVSDRY